MTDRIHRVLVVDDDRDVADLLTEILLLHDIAACAAYSGAEALAAARHFQPETVLLDLWLPDLDGFRIAAILRAGPMPPYLVAMSAVDDAAALARTQAAGFDLHIRKPLSVDTIVAAARGTRY